MASIAPIAFGPVDMVEAAKLNPALDRGQSVQKVAAFDAAMARHAGTANAPMQTAQLNAAQPTPPASAVNPAATVNPGVATNASQTAQTVQAAQAAQATQASQSTDALRARRALELDSAKATGSSPAAEGDAILKGLEGLRGQFDRSLGRVNTVLGAQNVDAKTLLAVQVEVVNFTMMVDMTSKLTGKSTQTLDSLMKGQ